MNPRLSLALHVLCLLATQPQQRVTSEYLANSIGTNPVVIRRLLARLRQAGLVTSKGAAGGGWQLSRPAAEISVRSVRAALGEEVALRRHKNQPHPQCPVGRGVNQALDAVYASADAAIDAALEHWSIAQVLELALQVS
ncbi:MAG: Rrf2 family transcriptional regulator [Acidobacteriota bacterium]|nr:Rrf2 family transcriptional regulator [Acidobacteriota bacterium]